eukprot:gene9111-11163_t
MDDAIANALLEKYSGVQDNSDIRLNDSGDEKDNDDHDEHHHIKDGEEPDFDSMSDDQYLNYLNSGKGSGGGNQTGVKGVLNDYREHQEFKRQEYLAKKDQTRRMLENMCFTTKDQPVQQPPPEVDSDEEDELKRLRQKRLEQLKNQIQPTPKQLLPKNKVFGSLRQITADEYVNEIDNEPPNIFIIIHLYQNYVPECVLLNEVLSQMAVKYKGIKFLKILSTDAKANYHDAALPSLLVYIGGDLLVSFIPLTEELGSKFDTEDLELLLSGYDIIPNPLKSKQWERSLSYKNNQDDYDEDD